MWNAFLEDVKGSIEAVTARNGQRDVWFRGQPRGSHALLPPLLRGYLDPGSQRTRQHIRRQEQRLYREFVARVREFHGVVNEDWDNLFAMQHCGAPTRLLEWSESLPVGLYFALHRFDGAPGEPAEAVPEDPPCLWILNPHELNTRTVKRGAPHLAIDAGHPGDVVLDDDAGRYGNLLRTDHVSWQEPVAMHPVHRTARMQIQRSWFTMHGESVVALDELEDRDRFLVKVEIPAAVDSHAREYLRECGINVLTLFRDLPHIGVHLNHWHEAEKLRLRKAMAM